MEQTKVYRESPFIIIAQGNLSTVTVIHSMAEFSQAVSLVSTNRNKPFGAVVVAERAAKYLTLAHGHPKVHLGESYQRNQASTTTTIKKNLITVWPCE